MGHFILADLTAEPLAVHPGGLRSQSVKVIQAAVDAAGAGGAEGNDGGVAKVTVLQKGIEYLGCLSPPDGILPCCFVLLVLSIKKGAFT